MLVSPCPPQNRLDDSKYVHLAKFMREGPPEKIEDIWKKAAEDLLQRLRTSSSPWWLSTSGDGVAWLHIRIDPRPIYYLHSDYRQIPWTQQVLAKDFK